MRNRRRRLWIDSKIQSAILLRVFVYWLFCVLFIMVPQVIINTMSHPEVSFAELIRQLGTQYWLSITLAFLLLPMTLMDALRLSHGFIGPVIRLRREVARINNNPELEPIKFRKEDFWGTLAVEVDRFSEEVREKSQREANAV